MQQFLTESELNERAVAWTHRLGVVAGAPTRLSRPALCVLDMQHDFLRDDGALPVWGGPAIVPRIAALIRSFRRAARPIFYSRHICLDPSHADELGVSSHIRESKGLLREGTQGSAIVDELRPEPGDHVITKYRYSAFFGSPLELLLRAQAVQDVVIAGVVTNVCCETTAHDAFFRDFGVAMVLDGTGAFGEEAHLATLSTIRQSYGQVVTAEQVCKAIEHDRRKS